MPCIDPFGILPIQRDCICPAPERGPGEHTAECGDAYKAKLLGRKQDVRDEYYGTDRKTLN